MPVYAVDSRRDWSNVLGVVQFKSIVDFNNRAVNLTGDDLIVIHISDLLDCFEETPGSVGDGDCFILFYTGGGGEDMAAFKNSLSDEYVVGGRFAEHNQGKVIFYDMESVPEDLLQSNLWKFSLKPFLDGKRNPFVVLTPELAQYGLAAKVLARVYCSPGSGVREWPCEKQKLYWEPLFTDAKRFESFLEHDPYGWASVLEEVKKVYDGQNSQWENLDDEVFRLILEES